MKNRDDESRRHTATIPKNRRGGEKVKGREEQCQTSLIKELY